MKISETFINFAEKKLGDYYAEQETTDDSGHSISTSGYIQDGLDDRRSRKEDVEQAGDGANSGVYPVV